MSHGDISLSETFKIIGGKDAAEQAGIPVRTKDSVTVYHDSGTFLPSVLQRIQSVIDKRSERTARGRKDAEYAAFLADMPEGIMILSLFFHPVFPISA